MPRLLLKVTLLGWAAFVLLLIPPTLIGKAMPEIIHLGFFSQQSSQTDYWHLDLLTGVTFRDRYSPPLLISVTDSVAENPLSHFLSAERDRGNYSIYRINLSTGERHFLISFPAREHSIHLERDFLFTINYSRGSDEWTKIHLPSHHVEPFLSDTRLEHADISPDNRWFAGLEETGDYLFLNLLDNSSYRLSGYCCLVWSPDSQWYIAIQHDTGLGSVMSAATGLPHPIVLPNLPMTNPRWTMDSQSIVFQDGEQLASIALATGEISHFLLRSTFFQTNCISPNQQYILNYQNPMMLLSNLQTGVSLWQQTYDFSSSPSCFWSEDSRYLAVFLSTAQSDSQRNFLGYAQRFVFTDTATNTHWTITPQNMPPTAYYIHQPE